TVKDLSRSWPAVAFTWDARALIVYVSDPLAVLPASREARAKGLRLAQGSSYIPRSGPFAAFTGDDRGRSAWEGGYSYKGRVAVTLPALPAGAQVGRSGGRTAVRVSYGPVPPSPFVVPSVP